ncbi:MAG: ubiquitin-activating E1 FCCH domain-containing protein [Capsulimonadaceae bacterium]
MGNYPQQLSDLIADVQSRLNEPANSTAGDLASGSGTSTIATVATIAQYLNEAAADLARYAWPIADIGSAALAAGVRTAAFGSLTVADGNSMWAARAVSWDGVPLQHASQSALEHWFGSTYPLDTGMPLFWTEQGQAGVLVYPAPSTVQTLTVNGLAIPKPMVNSGLAVVSATDTSPIVVTTTPAHGLDTGQTVGVSGVAGNTAANGTWTVTVTSPTAFSLNGSTGNGAYVSGGVVSDVPAWLAPDAAKLLVFHAAARIALKNAEDPSLSLRESPWWSEWEVGKEALLARLWQDDPQLAAAHYPQMKTVAQSGDVAPLIYKMQQG